MAHTAKEIAALTGFWRKKQVLVIHSKLFDECIILAPTREAADGIESNFAVYSPGEFQVFESISRTHAVLIHGLKKRTDGIIVGIKHGAEEVTDRRGSQ